MSANYRDGLAAYEAGNYSSALTIAEELFEAQPSTKHAFFLGLTSMRACEEATAGDMRNSGGHMFASRAIASFERAVALSREPGTAEQRAARYATRGRAFYMMGQAAMYLGISRVDDAWLDRAEDSFRSSSENGTQPEADLALAQVQRLQRLRARRDEQLADAVNRGTPTSMSSILPSSEARYTPGPLMGVPEPWAPTPPGNPL